MKAATEDEEKEQGVKFYGIVDQVIALLRSRGRLSYRALKVEFALSDDDLVALKEELIDVQELAIDKDGKMLVWKGDGATPSVLSGPPAHSQPLAPQRRRRPKRVFTRRLRLPESSRRNRWSCGRR